MDRIIKICRDYSETLGARYISDGEFSGEDFRKTVLFPLYSEVKKSGDRIIVDLDGGYGNPVSFVEEAFGGLARELGSAAVLSVLDVDNFISHDVPSLIEEIKEYINHPFDNKVYKESQKRKKATEEAE